MVLRRTPSLRRKGKLSSSVTEEEEHGRLAPLVFFKLRRQGGVGQISVLFYPVETTFHLPTKVARLPNDGT